MEYKKTNRIFKFKRAYFFNEDKTEFLGYKMWGVNIDESIFTAPTNKSNSMSFIDYQYTESKDIYGKEIYGGHLLQCGGFIGEVYYEPNGCKYMWRHIRSKTYFDATFHDAGYRSEIIGDIHENPELLK